MSSSERYVVTIMAYGLRDRRRIWWSVKDLEKEVRYMFGLIVRRSEMLSIIDDLDRQGRLEFLGTSKRRRFRLKSYTDEEVICLDEVDIEGFGLSERQINAIFDITPRTARSIVFKCQAYLDSYRRGNERLETVISHAISDYKTMYGQRARKEMAFMMYVFGYLVGGDGGY